ncbi:MAG: D-tyrosyl-tRNA(Tyr) deacylase [Bacteroidia bacterium]
MRAILQRVDSASVEIDGSIHSRIDEGLLVLVGFEEEDTEEDLQWVTKKITQLRVFNDQDRVMNRSIVDVDGELLIVSQFTLHASIKKGNRPSYIKAAKPDKAILLYERFKLICKLMLNCESGVFGADMKVNLVNNGPVTISIDSKRKE